MADGQCTKNSDGQSQCADNIAMLQSTAKVGSSSKFISADADEADCLASQCWCVKKDSSDAMCWDRNDCPDDNYQCKAASGGAAPGGGGPTLCNAPNQVIDPNGGCMCKAGFTRDPFPTGPCTAAGGGGGGGAPGEGGPTLCNAPNEVIDPNGGCMCKAGFTRDPFPTGPCTAAGGGGTFSPSPSPS